MHFKREFDCQNYVTMGGKSLLYLNNTTWKVKMHLKIQIKIWLQAFSEPFVMWDLTTKQTNFDRGFPPNIQ